MWPIWPSPVCDLYKGASPPDLFPASRHRNPKQVRPSSLPSWYQSKGLGGGLQQEGWIWKARLLRQLGGGRSEQGTEAVSSKEKKRASCM
jgi:hypothetical protein